jgi:prevent-host-death family protein
MYDGQTGHQRETGMRISATDAKNRFGQVCSEAKRGPVIVEKGGRPDTVIVSFEQWESVTRPSGANLRARRRQFVEAHREWLDAYREQVEREGTFGATLRAF